MELKAKAADDKLSIAQSAGGVEWAGGIADHKLTLVGKGEKGGTFELSYFVRKSPTEGAKPPPGAIVLLPFEEGKAPDMAEWTSTKWKALPDGSMMGNKSGDDLTKRQFGDMKLHVEFMVPYEPAGKGQGRGNSGVYLEDRIEIQVLDSFGLKPTEGDCGAIYSTKAESVNASLPPVRWQTFDITYQAPRFEADGKTVAQYPLVTVLHNGVLVHDKVEVKKETTGGGQSGYAAKGPIKLQDHGHPVRFRNIWVVESAGK
jgi:hypothetical protein